MPNLQQLHDTSQSSPRQIFSAEDSAEDLHSCSNNTRGYPALSLATLSSATSHLLQSPSLVAALTLTGFLQQLALPPTHVEWDTAEVNEWFHKTCCVMYVVKCDTAGFVESPTDLA